MTERKRKPRIDCSVCGRNVVVRQSDGGPQHHYPPPDAPQHGVWGGNCKGGYQSGLVEENTND